MIINGIHILAAGGVPTFHVEHGPAAERNERESFFTRPTHLKRLEFQ
jgi:hypothetical protein